MKHPFLKAAWREIRKHPGRYLAILAIVALGVGFYSGLFVIEDAMLGTASSYITEYNLYDFSVSSSLGLYDEDVKALRDLDGIKRAQGVMTADAICEGVLESEQILHFISIGKSICRPEVVEGHMPGKPDECLADSARYTKDDIGKKIRLKDPDPDVFAYTEYTIVGIGNSVEYINYQRGSTTVGSGQISSFCYIPQGGFATDYYTAIYLDVDTDAPVYSKEYDDVIAAIKPAVQELLSERARLRGQELIEEAHEKIAEGVIAYEQAKLDLEKARAEAEQKFADAEAEIAQGKLDLAQGKKDLAELEVKVDLALAKATEEFNASMAEADELLARADAIAAKVDYDRYLEVSAAIEELEAVEADLEKLIKKYPKNKEYPVLLARVTERREQLEHDYADLLAVMSVYHDLRTRAQEIRDTAQETFDKLDLAATGLIAMKKLELTEGQTKLTMAEKKLNVEKNNAKREFTKAEQQLAEAFDSLKLPDDIDKLTNPHTYVITRDQNVGYISMKTDSGIVAGITVVFPVFFVLVAMLVCSTVMTRMVEDERTSLGTLKALGYTKRDLVAKYLIYAGSAALIGSISGFFIGTFSLPRVLWFAYMLMYDFTDSLLYIFNPLLLIASVSVALAACMGTAAICVFRAARQVPAQLMRPRVTASGKRMLIERITFIWKPLSFLSKVAIRNIWRYKKRLLVMILGIGGSTALLVTGFGLGDSIKNIASHQFDDIFLYDYEITFRDAQDETSLQEFTERNRGKIGSMMTMHQSDQRIESEHSARTATLNVSDGVLDGYVTLSYDGQPVAFPGAGQTVINKRLAELLKVGVGDALTLDSPDGDISVTVSSIVDNYIGNVVYVSTETYLAATGSTPEIKTALLFAAEEADAETLDAELRGDESVIYLESSAMTKDSVGRMMQSMNYVIITVIVCAGALAYIVLFNLTNINITERAREIATLRVLGLYKGETRRYVMTENYVLSVIGAFFGMPAGVLLHRYVMAQIVQEAVSFRAVIAWPSYLYSFGLTVLFAVLVGLALRPRIDRIPMAESLKSVE